MKGEMGMESEMGGDDLDSRILQEIIAVMGKHMGGQVKPKMLSVEMAGVKPEEALEEKMPVEESLEEPLDKSALEAELLAKGLEKEPANDDEPSDDDENSEDEFVLRKKGKIF